MMDFNVPILTVRCYGAGTVIVLPPDRFCMIRWLPFCRARTKPLASMIRMISTPEKTPNLGAFYLDVGEQGGLFEPRPHFLRARRLEESFQCLL